MNKTDSLAFAKLFKEAYHKCFAHELQAPLTETESKLFCNQVLEITGLSIGWKSVKNYSFFVLDNTSAKAENPSAATLDTLARYVLGAPYTTEIQRKDNEDHYPWWFLYREKMVRSAPKNEHVKTRVYVLIAMGITAVCIALIFWVRIRNGKADQFSDDFGQLAGSTLAQKGWFVKDPDSVYWVRRSESKGQLTLFTLSGDNWPDPPKKQRIKNLLLRAIPYDCFTAEVHLSDFVPRQEWQQAGILLLEDTTLTGKSMRLSIAFNDNFGGFKKGREVLIQAVSWLGNGFGRPEEISHRPILSLDTAENAPQVIGNLHNTGLRIEKTGNKFRFLFSGGASENGAFREVANQELDIHPRYIGIFAIKGFKDTSAIAPVHFTFFRIAGSDCR